MDESTLVYSTESGRICSKCSRPQSKCVCRKGRPEADRTGRSDGIIRIKKETKGRKGKTVTSISGFPQDDTGLKKIASDLKNRCGTGGSVKDGVIVIQGDHLETVTDELAKKGYRVKMAGGFGKNLMTRSRSNSGKETSARCWTTLRGMP